MNQKNWFFRATQSIREIRLIEEVVWLNISFARSFREVELMLARRGIEVTYETIRQWCLKFGQLFANDLRRQARPGDKWHLEEVVLKIKGKLCYLWREVDQHWVVLDILPQCWRNTKAPSKFLKKLLKGLEYVPRVIITEKVRNYGAAKNEGDQHSQQVTLSGFSQF